MVLPRMFDSDSIRSTEDLRNVCDGTLVETVEFHDSVGSTNDRAAELGDVALPALVYADRQTQGRGRGNHRWWTTPGALTFSLVLDPAGLGFPESRWQTVSLLSAMAVGRVAVGLDCPETTWKWPNDVLAGVRKLSGILLEVPPRRNRRMIIGVGINVNNSASDLGQATDDRDLPSRVASLRELTGHSHPLGKILHSVLVEFHRLSVAVAGEPSLLPELWLERCFLQNRQVALQLGGRIVRGRANGIDADGALRLKTEAGEQRFAGGTIVSFD